jgi:hypothetical protein
MLIIREQQMQALARAVLPEWITNHLKQFFRHECAALGDAELSQRVNNGIERATSHGFETQVQISQYLDLIFTFGPDFDTDKALSWPAPILADRTLPPALRIQRLLDAGSHHLTGA